MDEAVSSHLPVYGRVVLALLVLVHAGIHVSAVTGMWWPLAIPLLLYPMVVDRYGLTGTSTKCENCGADNVHGGLVCGQCQSWLGSTDGYRELLLGGLVVPLVGAAVEVVLFGLLWVGLSLTSLFLVVARILYHYNAYGGGAIIAVLTLFAAGVAYVVVRGITSTLLCGRRWPSAF